MGILVAIVLWCMSALVLTEYEINVRVLRPWVRQLYAVGSTVAGIILAVLLNRRR